MSINCKVILRLETARFSLIGDFFGPAIQISLKIIMPFVCISSSGLNDCQKKVLDIVLAGHNTFSCWGRQ